MVRSWGRWLSRLSELAGVEGRIGPCWPWAEGWSGRRRVVWRRGDAARDGCAVTCLGASRVRMVGQSSIWVPPYTSSTYNILETSSSGITTTQLPLRPSRRNFPGRLLCFHLFGFSLGDILTMYFCCTASWVSSSLLMRASVWHADEHLHGQAV